MLNKLNFRIRLEKDNFIYSQSRKSVTRNILSVTFCIVAAIVISLVIAAIFGYDPFNILKNLFTKGFIDYKTLIWNIVVLGTGALAFSFAYKAKIFNIGIPGQLLGSGLVVLVVTDAINKTGVVFPNGLGQIFSLLVAIIAGALIATFIALLKVYLNVNEVVSSILLNWIIFFASRFIVYTYYKGSNTSIFSQSIDYPEQFRLVAGMIGGWLPSLIIFVILIIGMLVVLRYTTFGHKISAVGFSPTASKYAGYNYRAIHLSTMAISGAIVGIMALVLYTSGQSPSMPFSYDYDSLPNQGFNGIAIGLIALNNPIAIIPVSFIIGLFTTSSPFLVVSPSFTQVIMGVIILGATMFVILTKYKPWLWFMKQIHGANGANEYQGYQNQLEVLISQYRLKISEISKNGDDITSLYQSYLEKRAEIIAQHKKHILIAKATRFFFPNFDNELLLKSKRDLNEKQFANFVTKKNRVLASLRDDKNNMYNYLLVMHQDVFNMYNKYYMFKGINESCKRTAFFSFINYQYQKLNLFEMVVSESIKTVGDNLELVNDLNKMRTENRHRFEKLINSYITMMNRQFMSKWELWFYINNEFNSFSLFDKLQIFTRLNNLFRHYSNIKNWDKNKLLLEIQNLKLSNEISNNWITNLFIRRFKNKYKHYQKFLSKINNYKVKIESKIERSHQQLDRWQSQLDNHYKKRLAYKRRKTNSELKKYYEKYLLQAQNIKLDPKETKLLNEWLEQSFIAAQKQ